MWRLGKIIVLGFIALAVMAPPAFSYDPPRGDSRRERTVERSREERPNYRRDEFQRRPSRLYPHDEDRRRAMEQFMAHDQARRAVETGDIRPLGDIRRNVQRKFKGRIVGVDLQESGQPHGPAYIYDVRVLTPRGDVLSVKMDAGTGEIVGVKGKR